MKVQTKMIIIKILSGLSLIIFLTVLYKYSYSDSEESSFPKLVPVKIIVDSQSKKKYFVITAIHQKKYASKGKSAPESYFESKSTGKESIKIEKTGTPENSKLGACAINQF